MRPTRGRHGRRYGGVHDRASEAGVGPAYLGPREESSRHWHARDIAYRHEFRASPFGGDPRPVGGSIEVPAPNGETIPSTEKSSMSRASRYPLGGGTGEVDQRAAHRFSPVGWWRSQGHPRSGARSGNI
jgi:hypothetical protein